MKGAVASVYQSRKIMSHIKLSLATTSEGGINKVFSSLNILIQYYLFPSNPKFNYECKQLMFLEMRDTNSPFF